MEKKIVIYEPCFFPWVGFFELVSNADVFVHFDNIQFPLGRTFATRCQIKTADGVQWMTVPVKRKHHLMKYDEVEISYETDWRRKHLKFLEFSYARSPFKKEMLELVEQAYSKQFMRLSDLDIYATESVCEYFGLNPLFHRSSEIQTKGSKSELLLEVAKAHAATKYLTGLGGVNYLDYDLFERNNVEVEFIDYQKLPYRQNFGSFTPYVSILDLIANCSKDGKQYIRSTTRPWREFINSHALDNKKE